MVRLDAGAKKMETPVVVHLVSPDKSQSDVQLKDDGGPPDVTAGDGIWSGTIWSASDEFEVSLSAGTVDYKGGAVSWKSSDVQRDLNLSLGEGGLQAEAGVAQAMPAANGPTPGGLSSGSPTPPSMGSPEPASSGSTFSTSNSSDSTLYVAFGIGGLLLAIIGYLWMRGRGPVALPAGMSLVPEPGLFGAGTPSLSEGLSLWITTPNDAADLARLLLQSLARNHRVLVCASPRSPVPSVEGGPVYRLAAGKKSRNLADGVDALFELNPGNLAVLILAENLDAKGLQDHVEALPEGVGGLVLLMENLNSPLPTVRCTRREKGIWEMKLGEVLVQLQEGPTGLSRVETASGVPVG